MSLTMQDWNMLINWIARLRRESRSAVVDLSTQDAAELAALLESLRSEVKYRWEREELRK